MKLLDTWQDELAKIKNFIFEFPSGLKVVHSINPKSKQFDFSVIIKAGAYYETQLNLPRGTAHLLEHILFGNPNKVFKSKKEMDEYSYGTRLKPYFDNNAMTSFKFMSFYAHGHTKATSRIVKFIKSQIDYPLDDISEYIEKERGIVEGELQRIQAEEEDRGVQYRKFAYGDIYPELVSSVLGNKESLAKITTADLTKFYKAVMTSDNVIITIQSPTKLSKSVERELKALDRIISGINKSQKSNLQTVVKPIEPKFKYKHFKDNYSQGIYAAPCFFYEAPRKVDYKRDRTIFFLFNVMRKVAYDELREKKSLVYDVSIENEAIAYFHKDRGFSFDCSMPKLLEALDTLHDVIEFKWKDYLNSEDGSKFFENLLSGYIFQRGVNFDSEYAENIGFDYILDPTNEFIKFEYPKAKKAALQLKKEDLIKYHDEFFKIVPAFWFVSPHEDEEVYEIFKKSKFFKKYN